MVTADKIEWCDLATLLDYGIPREFVARFRREHESDTRKLGTAKQSKRLYRIAAINKAIESIAN